MILPDFELHRPGTLDEACVLLNRLGDTARPIAGGTDILVDLKRGLTGVEHLISLRRIPELGAIIKDPDGTLRLGPMVTPNEIGDSPIVRESHLALAEAALTMAAYQIRNRATIGGNLVSAVPSADLPPTLIAMRAGVLLAGENTRREIALKDFFVGPRETVLARGEIMAQIVVPPPQPGTGAFYIKHSLRDASALAVVGVAALLVMEGKKCLDARIVLGAVAPTPLLAERAGAVLKGKKLDEKSIAEAAKTAAQEARPISDLRGTAEYRRALTHVLTERALRKALDRAASA
jgi:carbon-monoxide dehydrogenase medium subunit